MTANTPIEPETLGQAPSSSSILTSTSSNDPLPKSPLSSPVLDFSTSSSGKPPLSTIYSTNNIIPKDAGRSSTSTSHKNLKSSTIITKSRRKNSLSVQTANLSPEGLMDSQLHKSPLSSTHRRSQSYNSPILNRGSFNPAPTGLNNTNTNNTDPKKSPRPELGSKPFDHSQKSSNFYTKLKKTYPNIGITLLSILSWYSFSLSISLYNRWMFSNKNLDFSFPIIITSCHQFILFCLSLLTLSMIPRFRLNNQQQSASYKRLPDEQELDNTDESNDDELLSESKEEFISYSMSPREYVTKILPCSLASAGDIGLGNTAFRFITLSLYTMIKTSSLVFVLLWGVVFKLERMTCRILSIVLVMTFGVVMMVWGQNDDGSNDSNNAGSSTNVPAKSLSTDVSTEAGGSVGDNASLSEDIPYGSIIPDDDNRDIPTKVIGLAIRAASKNSAHLIFLGSVLVLLSACMSGLRWALTQIMLKKNKRTKNPILTILYLSPAMCLILIFIGLIVEGFGNFLHSPIWEQKGVFLTSILILIPGLLAFFMTLSEFVLLQYASLLTLSIAGIFKELLTIFTSWLLFGDKLTFINLIGLVITLSDIIWYNMYRFEQNSKNQATQNLLVAEQELLLQKEQPSTEHQYEIGVAQGHIYGDLSIDQQLEDSLQPKADRELINVGENIEMNDLRKLNE